MGKSLGAHLTRANGLGRELLEVEDKKTWFGHFLNRVAKPFATQA